MVRNAGEICATSLLSDVLRVLVWVFFLLVCFVCLMVFFPFGFFFLSFIFVLLFVGGFCLFVLIGGTSSFKVPSAVIKALVESHSSVTS